jgi:hypothetical protein
MGFLTDLNIKIITVCAIVLIIAASTGAVFYLITPYNYKGGGYDNFISAEKTDVPVVVVSDDMDQQTTESYFENCTDHVTVQNEMPVGSERVIIFLDSKWSGLENLKLNEVLSPKVPILYIGESPDIFSGENTGLGRSAFVENAAIYGLLYYPLTDNTKGDNVACYSAVVDDLGEALERAYVWADNAAYSGQHAFVKGMIPMYSYWYKTTFAFFDVKSSEYGWIRGMTNYSQIELVNETFYATYFRLQSMPGGGKATSNIYIESIGQSQLLEYSPLSSNGRDQILVSLLPVASWEYDGYGVTVKNNGTNSALNKYSIWHDVDETVNFYWTPTLIVPGKISYSNADGGYSGTDTYGVQFAEQKSRLITQYSGVFEVTCNVNISQR